MGQILGLCGWDIRKFFQLNFLYLLLPLGPYHFCPLLLTKIMFNLSFLVAQQ